MTGDAIPQPDRVRTGPRWRRAPWALGDAMGSWAPENELVESLAPGPGQSGVHQRGSPDHRAA